MTKLTKPEIPTLDSLPAIPNPYMYRIVVHPLEPQEKTAGGIIIPTEGKHAEDVLQQFGVIVSLGKMAFKDSETGEYLFDDAPKVGDLVMYMRHAGSGRSFLREHEVKDGDGGTAIEKKKFILLNDKDIVMKIDDATGFRLY